MWDTISCNKKLLINLFKHIIGNAQIFNGRPANVDLGHFPESVTISRRTDGISQMDVHPVVTAGL